MPFPEMVLLPGGTFRMGKDDSRPDERPAHAVTVAPFRAAVRPVTNAEYDAFVTAADHEPSPFRDEARFSGLHQPAVGVNWLDAVAFCAWLSAEAGRTFRLPTEAEREFAARGGLSHDWPWAGPAHPLASQVDAFERPHEPLSGCANGYGLLCMADNVHEWCADWYGADYYSVSPQAAPRGPETGTRRASRGGSWRHRQKVTRVNARSSIPPEFRYSDYGFRVYSDA